MQELERDTKEDVKEALVELAQIMATMIYRFSAQIPWRIGKGRNKNAIGGSAWGAGMAAAAAAAIEQTVKDLQMGKAAEEVADWI